MAAQQDTHTVKVPRISAIAIHYPGYINNVDKALETLGGEDVLHKALQETAGFLKLRLRPEDPSSHPLFGERRDQQGLILRIARPKDQPDAQPSITVASRVHASYTFSGLADYQYLGEDHAQSSRDVSQLSERNKPTAAEPFRTAQPFLLLPPIFSKQDMPVAFAFRDQPPPKESELDQASRKRVVSFYEPSLPPELPVPEAAYSTPQLKQQLEKLKELLVSRPAWPLELLLHNIPSSTADSLHVALHALCYQFKTGPWKSLFIACGFDPRASPDGRPYQMLAYRLPTEWAKAVKAAKAAGQPLQHPHLTLLNSFSGMPVHHTTYLQLVDLAQSDTAISQLLAGAPVPPGPSEAYGWFTYRSSQQLHQALTAAFSKTYRERLAQLQEQLQKGRQETAAGGQDHQQQQQQQQQQQEGAEQMDVDKPAAAGAAEQRQQPLRSMSAEQQQHHQQQQAGTGDDEAAGSEKAGVQAGRPPPRFVLGMLGLGGAEDELQQWLAEEAAAADERAQRRAAAAAAAGAAADAAGVSDDGGQSTDAGLSEGESEWATSGGETTADDEETDNDDGLDEYDR